MSTEEENYRSPYMVYKENSSPCHLFGLYFVVFDLGFQHQPETKWSFPNVPSIRTTWILTLFHHVPHTRDINTYTIYSSVLGSLSLHSGLQEHHVHGDHKKIRAFSPSLTKIYFHTFYQLLKSPKKGKQNYELSPKTVLFCWK